MGDDVEPEDEEEEEEEDEDEPCEYVTFSNHRSSCPWKGQAHYYSLMVDGDMNENAVWYYPEPSEAAKEIKGRVAFWKGVKVT